MEAHFKVNELDRDELTVGVVVASLGRLERSSVGGEREEWRGRERGRARFGGSGHPDGGVLKGRQDRTNASILSRGNQND